MTSRLPGFKETVESAALLVGNVGALRQPLPFVNDRLEEIGLPGIYHHFTGEHDGPQAAHLSLRHESHGTEQARDITG
jgi:hypothetical protein